MRVWIGKFIVTVGIIHAVFGLVVFRGTLNILLAEGLINTVNGQPDRELAFWFIAFGILAILLGALTDWCERRRVGLPQFLGWSLLGFTALLLLIMPISGAWLLLVPSMGAIVRVGRSVVGRDEQSA